MVDDILVRAMLYAQLDAIDKPPSDEPDEPVDTFEDNRPPGGVALTLRGLTRASAPTRSFTASTCTCRPVNS